MEKRTVDFLLGLLRQINFKLQHFHIFVQLSYTKATATRSYIVNEPMDTAATIRPSSVLLAETKHH